MSAIGKKISGTENGGRDMDVVLERAREEESSQRTRGTAPQGTSVREKKISDLDSPVLRVNRKAERRRFSTFNIILLLFGIASAVVVYIGHIISVNHLAIDADKLAEQYDDLLQTRAKLQAEIDKKSGRERIVNIASARLGLKPPTGQAHWIVIDSGSLLEAPE